MLQHEQYAAVYLMIQASANMVIDNRGSLGFGEESLRYLSGKFGSQVPIINLE